jgi:hypothetical protein
MDRWRDCRPDSNRLRLTTVPDVESSDAGSTGMTMRGLHGRDAYDGADTGTDSGAADAPERHAGDPRSPDRAIVQDAETRTALALAYRQRVEAEPAACGPGDATPQGNQSRHSLATTGTEGDHAFRTPADENADSRDADDHQEQVQRQGNAGRATRDADLPPSARDLPDARDVLPNIRLAELDARKLSDYSLKPGHPGNNGKADGWRALGYDVDNPEGRRDAARELRGLICDELLARGKVAETRDTAYGPSHRVLSGLTGPNGRHATLVTCWLIEERGGLSVPRLTTAWVQPHRDKETER